MKTFFAQVKARLMAGWVVVLFLGLILGEARGQTIVTNYVTEATEAGLSAALAASTNNGGYVAFAVDGTIILSRTSRFLASFTLDAAGHNVVLSGNNSRRLFVVAAGGGLALKGLTLTGGISDTGGAILNDGGSLTVSGCLFTNNIATNSMGASGSTNGYDGGQGGVGQSARGGAICSRGATSRLSVSYSTFTQNGVFGGTGGDGGAGQQGNGGDGNTGGFAYGGAICLDGGTNEIAWSTFDQNLCLPGNGGIGGGAGVLGDSGQGGPGGYGFGGAIYNGSDLKLIGSLFVSNSVFGGNTAGVQPYRNGRSRNAADGGIATGGGVFNAVNVSMENCTFFKNTCNGGYGGDTSGGKYARAGNGGSVKGGALASAGVAELLNCTLAANQVFGGSNGVAGLTSNGTNVTGDASLSGNNGLPGIQFGGNIYKGAGTVTLRNSILTGGWFLNAFCSSGGIVDGGYNISSDNSCKFKAAGSSNNLNPKVVLTLNQGSDPSFPQTLGLLPDSPAIGAIPNDVDFPGTDQGGTPRPQGDRADIGALELEESALAPVILTQPRDVAAAGGGSVTLSVVATGEGPLSYQWTRRQVEFTVATNPVVFTNLFISTNWVVGTNLVATNIPNPNPIGFPIETNIWVVSTNAVYSTNFVFGTNYVSGSYVLAENPIIDATNTTFIIRSAQVENSGFYGVTVSNDRGAATSSNALVQINGPVVIADPPHSQQALQGSDVVFGVAAWGTAPLRYQWYYGTNRLNGATNVTLQLTNVQSTNAGAYHVAVANPSRGLISQDALLTILSPPAIVTQPLSQRASQVTLNVEALGDAPLLYQWNWNGQPMAGATNQSLFIGPEVANSGRYYVVVNNTNGSAASSEALVVIDGPATITSQPQSTNAALGSAAMIAVTAWGTPPLYYQWMWNSNVLAGATNALLVLPNVQRTNDGDYSVTVLNGLGIVTSSNATLKAYAPAVIVTNPISQTVAQGSNATFTVAATGDAPLFYQWFYNGQAIVGASGTNFVIQSANVTNAGSYSVVVTNQYSAATSSNAVFNVNGPVVITAQPQSQTAFAGTNLNLSVTAWGGGSLQYQWYRNSNAVPGAISAVLNLNNAQLNRSAVYYVVVRNAAGALTSSNATVTVVVPATIKRQPQSQMIARGSALTLSVTADGTAPLSYQWTRNGLLLSGETRPALTTSLAEDGDIYAVIVNNNYRTVTSSNAAITVVEPASITVQPSDANVIAGSNVSLTVSASGSALQYQWWYASNALAKTAFVPLTGANSATNFMLAVMPTNAGLYKVVVSNVFNAVTSLVATVRVSPVIDAQPQGQLVIAGRPVILKAAVSGSAPIFCQWFRGGEAIGKATNLTLTIPRAQVTNSDSYFIVASNVCGAITSSIAEVRVCSGLRITRQPASASVGVGTNVVLSVAAIGSPLFYQWTFNGNPISGETNAVFSRSVDLSQSGAYQVVLTNALYRVLSAKANLAVYVPASITNFVQSQTNIAGTKAVLSVEVTGTAPFSYQWKYKGKDMPRQTRSNLVFNAVRGADAGAYTVKVKNVISGAAGPTASATNQLVVAPPAPIINSPTNGSRFIATNISLAYTIPTGVGVTQIVWAVNGRTSTLTTGKGGTLLIALSQGTNTLELSARAAYGVSSVARAFYFVTERFAGKGNYTGLFYETNAPQHASSGFVQLTVDETRAYSGKLLQGTNVCSLSGIFDSSDAVTNQPAGSAVRVELAFRTNLIPHMEGAVSGESWTSTLWANSVFTNKPHTGRYTIEIPPAEGLAMGSGVAAVTVDTSGNVVISGWLADNTPFNQSMTPNAEQWPLYASLYSGKGSIFGWIDFNANAAEGPLSGALNWFCPAASGKLYPDGFTNQAVIESSAYTNFAKPLLNLTNGRIFMTNGNLTLSPTNSVVLTSANKFVISSTNQLKLTLNATNGVVTGSFVHPLIPGKTNSIQGVLMQNQNAMKGFFVGTNQSGTILLQAK